MTLKMDRLVEMFSELETAIDRCSKCGMCQAVCPLYGKTRNENDVARGKLALLAAMGHHLFDRPEGVLERLNRCLLCGSCAASCPNGVDAMAIFLKARTILSEAAGLPWIKKILLKQILGRPEVFEKWVHRGVRLQKWAARPESPQLGTASLRFSSLLGKRHFPPLAEVPFYQLVPADLLKNDANSPSAKTVLFYPGCLINHVFPNVGAAVVKALTHHQVTVILPDTPVCCGMPALSAGDAGTARNLARRNLAELRGLEFDRVITACPTCAYTIKEIWPMILGNEDPEQTALMAHVAAQTLDISQFIHMRDGTGDSPAPVPEAEIVTYHDPCHLKKSMGIWKEPRALISANPNYRLEEMKQPDRCCGMGGSFGVEHFELSDAIGHEKLAQILNTNCRVVASGCPACMLQLSHILSTHSSDVQVKHPIEIYAEKISDG